MSTTRTEILATIAFLSAGLADQTECSRLYTEVAIELAHDPRAWMSAATTLNTGTDADTSDADQLELRTAVVKLLGLFYSHRQLSEETVASLAGFNPAWRDEIGDPWCFTRQGEDARIVRLYPKPRLLPVTGESLTNVTNSAFVIYCDARTDFIPDVLHLPIALLILAREFERESNHRDLGAAEIWRAMGTNILAMIA